MSTSTSNTGALLRFDAIGGGVPNRRTGADLLVRARDAERRAACRCHNRWRSSGLARTSARQRVHRYFVIHTPATAERFRVIPMARKPNHQHRRIVYSSTERLRHSCRGAIHRE